MQTFDIAIVSRLFSADSDTITIHSIHTTCGQEVNMLFTTRAMEVLGEIYANAFIGQCDKSSVLPGQYFTTTASDSQLHVYMKPMQVGWFASREAFERVGDVSYQIVGSVLPELKQAHAELTTLNQSLKSTHMQAIARMQESADVMKTHLTSKLDALMDENNRLQQQIAILLCDQQLLSARDAECKRLIREVASMRESMRQDTETIINLNNEIGILRAGNDKICKRFDYSMGAYRAEDRPVVMERKSAKPEQPAIPDAGYDRCVQEICNFDLTKLRTRKQRDALMGK